MALTPQDNDAFKREVDEELRRDQMLFVWQRYGRWILIAVVAGLLALAGWLYWQHQQNEIAGRQGEQLDAALADLASDNAEAAQPVLAELAGSDIDGYRAAALFSQANLLLQEEDLEGAAAKFAEVANDPDLPEELRNLARIRQTAAEYDTLDPQAVISRLSGLAVPESPWFGTAGEMVATAYLRAGNREAAGELYGQIARSDDVPPSIRQRVVQMASLLGVDVVDDASDAAATAPQAEASPAGAGTAPANASEDEAN